MIKPPLPNREAKRLKALRELVILDTPPEDRFDRISAFAAKAFNVPTTLVSLVDRDRQWFKLSFGLVRLKELDQVRLRRSAGVAPGGADAAGGARVGF